MGTLFVVATPIGNLSDFSLRGIETLKTCDYILAEDTRQTIKLLNHFEIKNKMVSYHKFNEEKKSASVIEDLKSGKNIALVSDAGTPCISDPGYILVKHARENNIKVASVPGCSAVIAALSAGGLDTSTFTFYGFVPTENKPKKELFESIKHSNIKTKVVYESPKRIIKLLKELKDEMPGCVICVASEITKVHESYEYGKIEDIYKKMKDNPDSLKGEYVILIQNEKEDEKESAISIEAMLVDIIIKEKRTIKDAIKILNEKQKDISKKDIYNASLNLKEILK